jgi:protocatechuate 3,4-dioxygenase beta subunit
VLASVLLATGLVAVEHTIREAPNAEAFTVSSMVIDLRADDFAITSNADRVLRAGADVRWRNRSGRTLQITSANGVLDSGSIPDGGSFYASLPVPGGYTWDSDVGGGTLLVGADFEGSPAALALDSIPDVTPPPVDPSDISLHPTLRIELPRNRLIVGFTPTATVEEAEAALGNDWVIVGGLPRTGLVVLQRSFPLTTHSDAVVDDLRAKAAVEFATYDTPPVETALPDASDDVTTLGWHWDATTDAPFGRPENWMFEAAGIPAVWNLDDALDAMGATGRSTTLVLDSGFGPHPDLDALERPRLCSEPFALTCTSSTPTSHGIGVAAIIGADHDAAGIDGVDRFSRLVGVPWSMEQDSVICDLNDAFCSLAPGWPTLELVLREIDAGRLPMPDVMNLSVGMKNPAPQEWWAYWDGRLCGPGPDDDAAGTQACLPDREDGRIEFVADYSRRTRRVVEAFVRRRPDDPTLFVAATGNDSSSYCETARNDDCTLELAAPMRSSRTGSSFAWVNENWNPDSDPSLGQSPILMVEAIGTLSFDPVRKTGTGQPVRLLAPDANRSRFSNISGEPSPTEPASAISAPGGVMAPALDGTPGDNCVTVSGGTYCANVGTSLATPLVAGVAGLLSSWDPSLTAHDIKRLLTTWSIADTTDGAAPRIDAFASLMALDGVARALVDVNDPTVDGNRRIVRDEDGSLLGVLEVSSTTPGRSTEADDSIDMRDFRRFRDAWLLRCRISPEAGCPTVIDLDGEPDHPKFDLNLDGCVSQAAPGPEQICPSELTFPRFDFNGDGDLSLASSKPVPLGPDGSPAVDRTGATEMTDLQVLQSQWDDDAPVSLGVTAADLDELMVSGDVSVLVDALAAAGATTATVSVLDDDTDETYGSLTIELPSLVSPVITAPAERPLRLEVTATTPAGPFTSTAGPIELVAGEDRWIDPCATLDLSTDRDVLRPGQGATVAVQVTGCGLVDGVDVTLSIDPVGPGGLTFDNGSTDVLIITDTAGQALAPLVAGTQRNRYTITATAQIPIDADRTVERSATIDVAVTEAYELGVVAVDGDSSGYALLEEWARPGVPIGPSVNGNGDVAFGGLARDDDRYRVFVAPPTGVDPADPLTVDRGTGTEQDMFLEGDVQINDAQQFVFQTVRTLGSGDVETTIRRTSGDTTDVLGLGVADDVEQFCCVERPTINEFGSVVYVATQPTGEVFLARQSAGVVETGVEAFGARPRHADDGTTASTGWMLRDCAAHPERGCTVAEQQSGFLDRILLEGDGVYTDLPFAVAEQRVDGWGLLSDPDVTASGEAIVFIGDRNGERGVFAAVRQPGGGRSAPIPIAGPAALDAAGIVALELDRPTVVQIPLGADGPADDRLLVAVRGQGVRTDGQPSTATGIWVVDVELRVNDTGSLVAVPQRTDVVVEAGDPLLGTTVAEVRLADSLAAARSPRHVSDHWVAVYARTADGRNAHLRARSVPPPTTASSPIHGIRTLRSVAGDPADVRPAAAQQDGVPHTVLRHTALLQTLPQQATQPVVLDGPHVAAVTVDDDEPAARTSARVVNRSRSLGGAPAWALLDQLPSTSDVDVLDTPRYLAPDEAVSIDIPDVGNSSTRTPDFAIGAPLVNDVDANDVEFSFSIQPGENRPPTGTIVDGPYQVLPGQSVTARALGTDPDFDTMTYTWDLDADGEFDDHGSISRVLSAADLDSIVCGGSCEIGTAYPIAVRILDARGLATTVSSSITVVAPDDLAVTIQPTLLRVNPGQNGTVYVSATGPVGVAPASIPITVENLPTGWTSAPTTPSVTTGGTGTLTIRVPTDAPEGTFDVDVVARYAGREWRQTVSVVTAFGLIPQCTARISGTLVDDSGQPIGGASVRIPWQFSAFQTSTGSDGRFSVRSGSGLDIVLPTGFQTWRVASWSAVALGHVDATFGDFFVSCGDDVDVTGELERIRSIDGVDARVVVGAENPITPSRPVPIGPPLDDASVTFRYTVDLATVEQTVRTDADGRAAHGPIPLSAQTGTANAVTATAFADGYWPALKTTRLDGVGPGDRLDLGDFALMPICTGTLGGGRVIDQDGQPVADARVSLGTESAFLLTDTDGRFRFDREVNLGTFNTPRSLSIRARNPLAWPSTQLVATSARLERCGGTTEPVVIELERPAPPPAEVYGDVVGQVTDSVTGEPVEGVQVQASAGKVTLTDADGRWALRDLLIGNEPITARNQLLRFTKTGYWQEEPTVMLQADATGDDAVVFDLQMVFEQRVSIRGTVTDLETGEPIAGALVNGGQAPSVRSDADGGYQLDGVLLSPRNEPRLVFLQAGAATFPPSLPSTHWPVTNSIEVSSGGDHLLDFEMLRICANSSISGVVLNAATLEPLEGARVSASVTFFDVTTDADGRYRIDNIRPATLNEPRSVQVTASAPGFAPSSVNVTTFCGSETIVDFGTPPGGFGTVSGTVTDGDGQPLAGVFVGSAWGDATTTDTDGRYVLDRAPLTSDGGPRTWTITAVSGSDQQSRSVVVSSTDDAIADFTFAEDPDGPVALPTAVIAPFGAITEGDTVEFDASGSADPEGGALTVTWQLLDATGNVVATGAGPTWSHRFRDDFIGTVRATAATTDGRTAVTERAVEARNAPPVVAIRVTAEPSSLLARFAQLDGSLEDRFIVGGSFTDPGPDDTHTVEVAWGDGTVTPVDPENRAFSTAHRYTSAGTYTVSVQVCDDDGGCATVTESVEVKAVGFDVPVPEVKDPTPVEPGIPVPPVGADPIGPTTAPGPIITDLPETGSDIGSWLSVAIGLILLGWLGRQLAQRPRREA